MQSYLILNTYDYKYITFLPSQENKIIENSKFIKIFYSTCNVSLNGIYIKLDLNNIYTEKSFNKLILKINPQDIKNIDLIIELEKKILELYSLTKHKEFSLKSILDNSELTINSNIITKNYKTNDIILKISGIWDNEYKIGITYKFIVI